VYKNIWQNHFVAYLIYKSSVTSFIFKNYLYIDCILVIIQSDDGQNSAWNMLMKNNNMWMNILINVYLLFCHISNNCGLQQGRLLLINIYTTHISWEFIKGLSHTEVCLLRAARRHDLFAPATDLNPVVWSDRLQVNECCLCSQSAGDVQ